MFVVLLEAEGDSYVSHIVEAIYNLPNPEINDCVLANKLIKELVKRLESHLWGCCSRIYKSKHMQLAWAVHHKSVNIRMKMLQSA